MKNCDDYQEQLMDIFDKWFELPDDVRIHLDSCSSCSAFYEQLSILNRELTIEEGLVDIDHITILNALREGNRIRDQRSRLSGNIVFVLIALLVFAIGGLVVGMGYGVTLVVFQLIIFFMGPVIVPITIARQMNGASL